METELVTACCEMWARLRLLLYAFWVVAGVVVIVLGLKARRE
jgi:hypothetical protein